MAMGENWMECVSRAENRLREQEALLRTLLGAERDAPVFWLGETDSTNRQLRLLADAGAPAGTVLLSHGQSAGRGRLGRSFVSPAGKGLYLSVLLRPDLPPEDFGQLTPRAALAVRRALEAVCGLRPEVKWVNDLLCRGRKLCGILTEGVFRPGAPAAAVLGVGLNVSAMPGDFPSELRETVTSVLLETGKAPGQAALAAAVIRELGALAALSDGEADYGEYRAACVTLGRRVRLSDGTEGVAADVDRDYCLLVRLPDGTLRPVRSGEAVFIDRAAPR